MDDKLEIVSPDGEFSITYFKGYQELESLDILNKFVKGVEKVVRTSGPYSRYIAHLKEDLGLDYCQKHPNIHDGDGSIGHHIEMHHGPLFTLFDYCMIITTALIKRGERVTTFTVADYIMREHFDDHIQTIMLCQNCHYADHSTYNEIVNSLKFCFQDVQEFFDLWGDGIDSETLPYIENNLEILYRTDAYDSGLLQPTIPQKWGNDY